MQTETTFTLTIEAQEIHVRYDPAFGCGYGHFEFRSPHEPPRRIPVSETGYRSAFAPLHEIEEASSVEVYARELALAIMRGKSGPDDADDDEQLDLFGGQP